MVAAHPDKRTVTQVYHDALGRWWARQPLYDGGMQYLPTFIPWFIPFNLAPRALGDVAWRWVGWGGLVCGLWRFTKGSRSPQRAFALAALLALPVCLGSLRNGQANAHFGAAFLLAAVCLVEERWWAAVALLCFSVALKPLGVAALGLAVVIYPRLWWRFGVGLAGTLILPFLFGPFDYVAGQFLAGFQNLGKCALVTENRFADLNGLLRAAGSPLDGTVSLLVRAAAGLALALFCVLVARRLPARERALGWLACSSGYLMLFNPMTEANSYAILAPPLALWARAFLESGRPGAGWILAAAALTMMTLPTLLHPWLGNRFALAWFPLMAIVFMVVTAAAMWRDTGVGAAPTPNPRLADLR